MQRHPRILPRRVYGGSGRDGLTPLVLCLLLGVAVSCYLGLYLSSAQWVQVTVTKTERVVRGDSSKYLVFAREEVFENSDTLLFAKFNSSDVYAMLEPGKGYRLKVVGWRVPVLSMYRNIVAAEPAR